MLTKGIRNQDQEKLDQIIEAGLQIEFAPDLWKTEQRQNIDQIFQQATGLRLAEIESLPNEEWLNQLREQRLDFTNAEKIGDLMLKIIPQLPEDKGRAIATKAVMLYEQTQKEHKIFSLGLSNKINNAKAREK